MNFNIQLLSTFVLFGFRKIGLIESCSSLKGLQEYKISWSLVDWCKLCMHLISMNICYFGAIEAMGLKLWLPSHLQWQDIPTEFHRI
jgi:hypothetical protein